ncbi:hypothetical protein KZ389_04105, partial [Glaesserella parasuis]|nr:hypothetical protein [Glaesserella parasuis]MCT8749309.1 hypothetical protein [Glaesserella parasuis]MCT8778411.1 hypothetical protein [Glaesserella parasuis]MCT8792016.1 hypothetical protein [Glaesserella parasuis]
MDPSSRSTPREKRHSAQYSTKDRQVGLAYARSNDGILWEKPKLGIVDFEGSKENNIIMRDVAGTGILYEPTEVDPNKRFKLITRTGQPHMLSIFQPTRRAIAHLEIHLTNRQRSISLSYSAFSGVIVPSSTLIDAKLPDFPHPIHRSQHIRLL